MDYAFVVGFLVLSGAATLVYLAFRVGRKRPAESEGSTAEALNREAVLAAKEEGLRYREKVEADLRKREKEALRHEEKLMAREETLEARHDELRRRFKELEDREEEILEARKNVADKEAEAERRLGEVAGMTADQAREVLVERVEAREREALARKAREMEAEATARATRKAKAVLLDAMQRSAAKVVSEATVSTVALPSDDMKGRIIGREGRNIRAFEQITGVDLIIDDTPEAVVVSCFDPVRREVARLTLKSLIADGRIHPVRIEELYEKAREEVRQVSMETACQAAETAQVGPVPTPLLEVLGQLRFRTSYAQNVLDHSVEVSRLAGVIAAELGLDVQVAKRAGLFHDIGKALGPEHEGPHAMTGREFLLAEGETEAVADSVGSHHSEMVAATPEAVVVTIADSLSASRPGSRQESLENYVKRLETLEKLAGQFDGVERCFAVQAGREVRIIVDPSKLDDAGAAGLASDVARRIEKELEYPGQIKVTVIRETRVQDLAK